jgi:putative ABC transport system ATP-binding protein
MSESELAIAVRALVKSFDDGRIHALRGADLTVERGEFVAIMGPSGCGKSTLLHLIAALDRPDSGVIIVDGHDLSRSRQLNHYRATHIGLVFQMHNLLPALTALENVQIPMYETGLSARERKEHAQRLLELVGLGDKWRMRPTELSGGERQRVAVARALANDPPIILADEPTGSLDSTSGAQVLDLFARLQRERRLTIVMVTHDPNIAARADRIVHMLDGVVLPERIATSLVESPLAVL